MKNNFKRPIIIFNPSSAGGRAKDLFNKYYKIIKDSDLFENIDVFESYSKKGTISEIAEIHKNMKNDLIITIGGDGSISTVCNGIMNIEKEKRLPIFPLPAGSGNSFLLDFNINSINDSLKKFKERNLKSVDVLYVESLKNDFKWYCVNVVGLGFISNVAYYGEKYFAKFGSMRYIIGTMFALREFKSYKTTVKIDKSNIFESDRIYFISISNTKYTGGKIMIAPDAKYDDGLMDIVILHDITRFRYLKGFIKAFKGRHINEKGCTIIQAKEIEIHSTPDFHLMPDGELEGFSPVKIRVIPKQLKFIA